jgi:hypothetical protein
MTGHLGDCQFNGDDHEGERRGYDLRPRDFHWLVISPRSIAAPPQGTATRAPAQWASVMLCERHAKVVQQAG